MFTVSGIVVVVVAAAMVILSCLCQPSMGVTLAECGGIEGENSTVAAKSNSLALIHCFHLANSESSGSGGRVVEVPAGETYFFLNATIVDVHNVDFLIDGSLYLSNDIPAWPQESPGDYDTAAFKFINCTYLKVVGGPASRVDGQGYNWWWYVILGFPDTRPIMFHFIQVAHLQVLTMYATNAPVYHFTFSDVLDLLVENSTVYVSIDDQAQLLRDHGLLDESSGVPIPIFPLNTDGFDVGAKDAVLRNLNITNFDDTVVPKPLSMANFYSNCSTNITVSNCHVTYGVGMSIGSVTPSLDVTCIRGVVFEDITFVNPLKAIYIKPNPGTQGHGVIDNITYRRIHIIGDLWYPLWIGPQQQDQPGGGTNTGCSFFFPEDPSCPTDPRVTISNIFISDVVSTGAALLPGVIHCNATAPCENLVFTNMTSTGHFAWQDTYYCNNAFITQTDVFPPIVCNNSGIPVAAHHGSHRKHD